MMKKMIALLTALSCMASAASLTASACYLDEYTLIDGYPYELSHSWDTSLIVETDGTELTMDMFSENENISDVKAFEKTISYNGVGLRTYDYTPDGTAYLVGTKCQTKEECIALARTLMLEYDVIKDVHTVTITTRHFVQCYRRVNIYLNGYTSADAYDDNLEDVPDVSTIINAENMPELAEFRKVEPDPSSDTGRVRLSVSYDFNDQWHEMQESGMGDWELHQYFCAFVDDLNEKYDDIIDAMEPEVQPLHGPGSQNGTAVSPWDTAGDTNTDGAVDASDAADVLTIAAQNGTGAGIKATSANDVNAEGNVDASDAAAVLCYAAAQGTGAEVSWVDILRK